MFSLYTKKFPHFEKHLVDFQNLIKIQFCWRQFFETLIIYKPSLGSCKVPHKMWARSVLPFIGYKQTDKHQDKQSIDINRYKENAVNQIFFFKLLRIFFFLISRNSNLAVWISIVHPAIIHPSHAVLTNSIRLE